VSRRRTETGRRPAVRRVTVAFLAFGLATGVAGVLGGCGSRAGAGRSTGATGSSTTTSVVAAPSSTAAPSTTAAPPTPSSTSTSVAGSGGQSPPSENDVAALEKRLDDIDRQLQQIQTDLDSN
jgi:hypothetical protein